MNPEGKIEHFKTEAEAKAAGFDAMLSQEEAKELATVPEDTRRLEMYFIRWFNKFHKSKFSNFGDKTIMRKAYHQGFMQCLALVHELEKKEKENGTEQSGA